MVLGQVLLRNPGIYQHMPHYHHHHHLLQPPVRLIDKTRHHHHHATATATSPLESLRIYRARLSSTVSSLSWPSCLLRCWLLWCQLVVGWCWCWSWSCAVGCWLLELELERRLAGRRWLALAWVLFELISTGLALVNQFLFRPREWRVAIGHSRGAAEFA